MSATFAFFAITEGAILSQKALMATINMIPGGPQLKSNGVLESLSAGLLADAAKLGKEMEAAFNVFDQGSGAKAVGRFFQDVRNEMQRGSENAGIDKALEEFFDIKLPQNVGAVFSETLDALVDESLDSFFNDVEATANKMGGALKNVTLPNPLKRMNDDLEDQLPEFVRKGSADAIRMSFKAERDARRGAPAAARHRPSPGAHPGRHQRPTQFRGGLMARTTTAASCGLQPHELAPAQGGDRRDAGSAGGLGAATSNAESACVAPCDLRFETALALL